MTRPGFKATWVAEPMVDVVVRDTHVGDLELHFMPPSYFPPSLRAEHQIRPCSDPIPRIINSRRVLMDSDLVEIHKTWPLAIGAQVFVTGNLVVLFPDRKTLMKALRTPCPEAFGCMRIFYANLEIVPCMMPGPSSTSSFKSASQTTTVTRHIPSGAALSSIPQDYKGGVASVGLKLRLTNGEEVLTAVTHEFVKYRKLSTGFNKRTLFDAFKAMKIKLSTFNPAKVFQFQSSKKTARQKLINSPIGIKVFQAGTDLCVCIHLYTF